MGTYNQTRKDRDAARRLAHQDLVELHPVEFRLFYEARLKEIRSGTYVPRKRDQLERGEKGYFVSADHYAYE